jgi:hypothetical protein
MSREVCEHGNLIHRYCHKCSDERIKTILSEHRNPRKFTQADLDAAVAQRTREIVRFIGLYSYGKYEADDEIRRAYPECFKEE